MKPAKSPCIDICDFSGPKEWCLGCGRTRSECDKWKKMKPYDIKILNGQLKKRMMQLIKTKLIEEHNRDQ